MYKCNSYSESPSLTYDILAFQRALRELQSRVTGTSLDLNNISVVYTEASRILICIQFCDQREYLRKELTDECIVIK